MNEGRFTWHEVGYAVGASVSSTFITINHKDKRATFVSSANPEPTIVRVFKAMGWEVDE